LQVAGKKKASHFPIDINREEENIITPTVLEVVPPVPTPEVQQPKTEVENKSEAKTAAVWAAYSAGYKKRYKTEPLRNARTNSMLAKFLQVVPIEEAPAIATFFTEHNAARRNDGFLQNKCDVFRARAGASKKNILEIKQLLVAMSAYFQKPLTDMVIEMYANDLSDISIENLQIAFTKMRHDPKACAMFMPLYPAIIREYASSESDANLIAGEIIGAISQFGFTNYADAKEFLGEEKWAIVGRFGGWQMLTDLDMTN
jgi:hypothetical protein